MFDYHDLSYAFANPASSAVIKTFPEDFRVDEILSFDLSGEGEHLFLRIEKIGLTTEELVKSLSRKIKKSLKFISYAGLKDKQAITSQWISVHCPGEYIEGVESLAGEGWRVLECQRHHKKLKKGAVAKNQFQLILRAIDKPEDVEQRLLHIQSTGVPNYFGYQRFGHGSQNLIKAKHMLLENVPVKNRFLKGLYYSSARGFLFNRILSQRVALKNWNKPISGDILQLRGTNSIFMADIIDETLYQRVKCHDLSPASILWGTGEEKIAKEALILQQNALADFKPWLLALEMEGLKKSYRAQVLPVSLMTWQWLKEKQLKLQFELPAGSYATVVLRELVRLEDKL
ncbi:tRNA pseudouridine(13) synthase TruD [Legionella israelensis]|uniref:tRNA pseudouridine synthase D n=1 Tax=Legionella israelensis TaxID=454 RepID=A0A0W0WMR8_9GAMM|nr:tRNA pseudouridine(13) synthase TruD [Legionella israelensis]KTD33623.1 hydrogenase [Legionella israelensis]QBS08795.1 tRNA pseudouridine(13) synthase TruD [Legionella israelensis]SCY12509.1 tRNA pseudouridine13 synthase [Legionella israelensis DSM 19235]STX58473.1 hydrogenase [Legionella israelensis]